MCAVVFFAFCVLGVRLTLPLPAPPLLRLDQGTMGVDNPFISHRSTAMDNLKVKVRAQRYCTRRISAVPGSAIDDFQLRS